MQITERTRSLYRYARMSFKKCAPFLEHPRLKSSSKQELVNLVSVTIYVHFNKSLISANRYGNPALPGGLPSACSIGATRRCRARLPRVHSPRATWKLCHQPILRSPTQSRPSSSPSPSRPPPVHEFSRRPSGAKRQA